MKEDDMMYNDFLDMNRGREGMSALNICGEMIPCSRYLGGGKWIARVSDDEYELGIVNSLEPNIDYVRLSRDAVDIIGNLDI